MKLTRNRVLNILKYLDKNPNFYFPFQIICEDFNDDDDLFDFDCLDIEYDYIYNNKSMKNFILVENLQHLYKETTILMAKGFIDKIENTSALDEISLLAMKHRKSWKKNLCESEDIEEYGLNEFIGGKAEAYEDCMQIINEHLLTKQLLSLDTIINELENLAQIFKTNSGDSISYSDIHKWKEISTQISINEMSQSIIKIIDGQYNFDEEEIYLIAESIIQRIKTTVN